MTEYEWQRKIKILPPVETPVITVDQLIDIMQAMKEKHGGHLPVYLALSVFHSIRLQQPVYAPATEDYPERIVF